MTSSKLFVKSDKAAVANSHHDPENLLRRVTTCLTFLWRLRCPKHSHHLPSVGVLYHLLLMPVTSHLLWFLRTSPHLSAPEHQHAASLSCRPSAICHFNCPPPPAFFFFCLNLLKWLMRLRCRRFSKPATIPLCSGHLVQFEPLSPSLPGLFSCLISSIGSRQKASWASRCVYGINQSVCCEALVFVWLTENMNETLTMAVRAISAEVPKFKAAICKNFSWK